MRTLLFGVPSALRDTWVRAIAPMEPNLDVVESIDALRKQSAATAYDIILVVAPDVYHAETLKRLRAVASVEPVVVSLLDVVEPCALDRSLADGFDDVLGLSDAARYAVLCHRAQRRAAATARSQHLEQELLGQVVHYEAILRTSVDGIITIDERGRIELFNQAASTMFGYEPEEVHGKNISMLMPATYAEMHDSYLQRYLKTGERHIIGVGREVQGLRKDGTVFPLELAVSDVLLPTRRVFTGIVRDISRRRQLEQEILRISDRERRSIGYDLHDGLGQMLTGIGLITQNILSRLPDEAEDLAESLNEVTGLIREADRQARDLARDLLPVDLDAGGLVHALEQLCLTVTDRYGIPCQFEAIGDVGMTDHSGATHLYRIAREALVNAIKHAHPSRVRVMLAGGENMIRLRIEDDGVGYEASIHEHEGMGMRIMQYRARMLGATFEVRPGIEQGTVVSCSVPQSGLRIA